MGEDVRPDAPLELRKLFTQHIDIDHQKVALCRTGEDDQDGIAKALSAVSKDYPHEGGMDEKSAKETAYAISTSSTSSPSVYVTLYDTETYQFVGFIGLEYFQVSQEKCSMYFREEMKMYRLGERLLEKKGIEAKIESGIVV